MLHLKISRIYLTCQGKVMLIRKKNEDWAPI